MAENDATLKPGDNPPGTSPSSPAGTPGSVEPSNNEYKDWDQGRFINALGDKNKKLSEKDALIAAKEKELEETKNRLRQKDLADMDETERYKLIAAEKSKEAAMMKIKFFVSEELRKRKLENSPLAEIILETPWAIPKVRAALPEQPDWDQTESAVRAQLPAYLDTLVNGQAGTTIPTEPTNPATPPATPPPPSGREAPGTPSPNGVDDKRVWSRREIDKMDPETYKKNRESIFSAMRDGRLVP